MPRCRNLPQGPTSKTTLSRHKIEIRIGKLNIASYLGGSNKTIQSYRFVENGIIFRNFESISKSAEEAIHTSYRKWNSNSL